MGDEISQGAVVPFLPPLFIATSLALLLRSFFEMLLLQDVPHFAASDINNPPLSSLDCSLYVEIFFFPLATQ